MTCSSVRLVDGVLHQCGGHEGRPGEHWARLSSTVTIVWPVDYAMSVWVEEAELAAGEQHA